MGILNYTTQISVEKTSAEIQKKLTSVGVRAFMTEYDDDGIMNSMKFQIRNIFFRLPLNIDGVFKALEEDNLPPRFRSYEQASRVAWRIIKDWIEAQIALIRAGQADLVQVFLPYAQTKEGVTLYEVVKANGFKQLTMEGA